MRRVRLPLAAVCAAAGVVLVGACASTVDGAADRGASSTDSPAAVTTSAAAPTAGLDEDLVDPGTGAELSISDVTFDTVDGTPVAVVTVRIRNGGDGEIDPDDWQAPVLTVAGGDRTAETLDTVGDPLPGPVPPGASRTATYGFAVDEDELTDVTLQIGEVTFTGDMITVFAPTVVVRPDSTPQPQPQETPATTTTAPPIGFTGAPVGPPQPLHGKTIAECMTGNYEPGTTLFTDGTTGWTQECAP